MVQLHDPNLVLTDVTGDPDPLLSCDLMEGRDAFLTLAREKHWEFSSLRRAKYSTLAMLVTLHTQGGERFLYTCNMCQQPVETRYHCSECEVRLSRGLLTPECVCMLLGRLLGTVRTWRVWRVTGCVCFLKRPVWLDRSFRLNSH